MTSIDNLILEGPHGSIPVRHYRSDDSGTLSPGIVWLHGGSWVGGDLDMPEADWVSRELSARGISVFSVDYRLAPWFDTAAPPYVLTTDGDHFPTAQHETVFVFDWVRAHGADLGIAPELLSMGGASAGSNIAAGSALALRDRTGSQPRSLVLVYPIVHSTLPAPRPELAEKIAQLPVAEAFSPELLDAMTRNYLGGDGNRNNSYAFPGGHDLQGLPPTFILNSDHDTMRSSGERFASELAAAGVDLLVIREEGTRHGHLNSPDEPAASTSIDRMSSWLHPNSLVGRAHDDAR